MMGIQVILSFEDFVTSLAMVDEVIPVKMFSMVQVSISFKLSIY